MNLSEKNNQFK